ncbi:hypothetical protein KC19_2G067300 [Ceratodon purpureus]|uniref:Uncharacterized protein n=1 Tax=Ceratodon purpureus TaxID=3225 RepID=A0A8T0ISQ0_CERPU|nr:hypothetical protein KC19_2G067300 [Ceratodon purpureus]
MYTVLTPTRSECKAADTPKKRVKSTMERIEVMLDSFEQENHSPQERMNSSEPKSTSPSQLLAGQKIQIMITCLTKHISALRSTNLIKRTHNMNVGLEGSFLLERAERRKIISNREAEEFFEQLKNLQNRYISLLLQLYRQNHQAAIKLRVDQLQ